MINVNLLRPEKKAVVGEKPVSFVEEEREKKISVPAIVSALGISLGTIGLLFFLQNAKYNSVNEALIQNRDELAKLQQVLQKLAEVEETKKALDRKIKIIEELQSRRKDTVKMMDKLSYSLPDWVWLTSLSFNNNQVTIGGKAMSNNLISDFVSKLNDSGYFTAVNLLSSSRKKEGVNDIYNFQMVCQYRRPAEESGNK